MISKCLIVPYFGEYPERMPRWLANTKRMKTLGYDFLFDTDEGDLKKRDKEVAA